MAAPASTRGCESGHCPPGPRRFALPDNWRAALALSSSSVGLAPSPVQAAESCQRPGRGQDPQRRPPAPPHGCQLQGRGRAGSPASPQTTFRPQVTTFRGSPPSPEDLIWRARAEAPAAGSLQQPTSVLWEPSPNWSGRTLEESWGSGPWSRERRIRSRCPRLMNMQEPPPSLRDVTGRPGVSAERLRVRASERGCCRRASGAAAGTGGRARRHPKCTQPARRGGPWRGVPWRREPARAAGGSGSSLAAAARMLTGRLYWVPLLLALGVGSGSGGSGGGGGGSRRRRLLAAKGGCWGSFFLSEEGGRAGWRSQRRGDRAHNRFAHLRYCSFHGLRAPEISEVSALRPGPDRFHLQTPAQALGGVRDRGRGEVWGVWITLGAVCAEVGVSAWVTAPAGKAGAGRRRRRERQ